MGWEILGDPGSVPTLLDGLGEAELAVAHPVAQSSPLHADASWSAPVAQCGEVSGGVYVLYQ
jgi:hypothetical protein